MININAWLTRSNKKGSKLERKLRLWSESNTSLFTFSGVARCSQRQLKNPANVSQIACQLITTTISSITSSIRTTLFIPNTQLLLRNVKILEIENKASAEIVLRKQGCLLINAHWICFCWWHIKKVINCAKRKQRITNITKPKQLVHQCLIFWSTGLIVRMAVRREMKITMEPKAVAQILRVRAVEP